MATGEGVAPRGFTLLELLLVVAIIAIASAGVAFTLRDSGQAQLEMEAQRLAAVLESARAQARTRGVPVTWHASGVTAQVEPSELLLGPEPIIAPQSVRLWRTEQPQKMVRVATDGLHPFAVESLGP